MSLQLLIDGLRDITTSRDMLAASMTLVIYDWALTLPDEVKYLWSAKLSAVKMIYLVNRYIFMIKTAFAVYGWSGYALWFNHIRCKVWVTTDGYLEFLLLMGLHYVVTLRVWALWGRTRKFGIIIFTIFAVDAVISAYVLGKAMLAINDVLVPIVNVCASPLPSYLWAVWTPTIFYETLIFALTAYKAFEHAQQGVRTNVLNVLFRDGFLYFIFISLVSFVNLLWWATQSETKVIVLKYFTISLTQIAGSHLILDLLMSKDGPSIAGAAAVHSANSSKGRKTRSHSNNKWASSRSNGFELADALNFGPPLSSSQQHRPHSSKFKIADDTDSPWKGKKLLPAYMTDPDSPEPIQSRKWQSELESQN